MSETATDRRVHQRTRITPPPQNGIAIRYFRSLQGFSQNQFAKEIGMDQANLSRLEAETQHGQMPTLVRIARGLSVPVAAILRDADLAA
jgi:transcriptional regulator with XRE-family HTH domain